MFTVLPVKTILSRYRTDNNVLIQISKHTVVVHAENRKPAKQGYDKTVPLKQQREMMNPKALHHFLPFLTFIRYIITDGV